MKQQSDIEPKHDSLIAESTAPEKYRATPTSTRSSPVSFLALLVALCGLFAAGVLGIGHWLDLPLPCGESSGCVIVAMHPASKLFSVPIAYFGVAAYIASLLLWWRAPVSKRALWSAFAIAALGTLLSAALVLVSVKVIQATCLWCIASAIAMSILLVLSIAALRSRHPLRTLSGSTVLSLAFLLVAALALQTRFMRVNALRPPIPVERIAAVPARQIVDTANTIGPRDAPVTIVLFTDMWCPGCRRVHPAMMDYQRTHPQAVRLVYRHLPLYQIKGHEFSGTAAALSEIAAEKGKFWDFIESVQSQNAPRDSAGYLKLISRLGFMQRPSRSA
jgi:protein-disulfide isomerase